MISLRSRAVLFLLRHRHWFRGRLRQAAIDANTSIPALRARAERSTRMFGKLPADLLAEPVSLGGVAAQRVRPAQSCPDLTLLYFHGGGYVMGSSLTHQAVVARFAAGTGMAAYVFDYRLAPEHPFPAALDDALAAYTALLAAGTRPQDIAFAGDSAGGGLALATLLAARDRGHPLPACAALMSPWTDLTCSGASYRRPDPLAPAGSWHVFSAHYAAGQPLANPLISPLWGDLAGLPPLMVTVGEQESMLDDSVALAARARTAGVDVRLEVGEGMVHGYPTLFRLLPEAERAMADLCAFVRARTGAADGQRQAPSRLCAQDTPAALS